MYSLRAFSLFSTKQITCFEISQSVWMVKVIPSLEYYARSYEGAICLFIPVLRKLPGKIGRLRLHMVSHFTNEQHIQHNSELY